VEQVRSTKPIEPFNLAAAAAVWGITPEDALRKVLSESATYAEAARTLGVSRQTLRKYRQRYGVQMVRHHKGVIPCPHCSGTGMAFKPEMERRE